MTPIPSGQRFGRMTVLHLTRVVYSKPRYMCRCDCGTEKEARLTDLQQGRTVSCGCWKTLPRNRNPKQGA